MNAIVANDIFSSAGGSLVSIIDAEIIETTKKTVEA